MDMIYSAEHSLSSEIEIKQCQNLILQYFLFMLAYFKYLIFYLSKLTANCNEEETWIQLS